MNNVIHSLVAFMVWSSFAYGSEIVFSFTGSVDGVGKIVVEDKKILSIENLPLPGEIKEPFKVAYAPASSVFAVAVKHNDMPALLLFSQDDTKLFFVPLPGTTSDLTASDEDFVVATSKGRFLIINAASGAIVSEFNARQALRPPGRKGEFLCLLPDKGCLLVSFQKDDDNSEAKGNRLVSMRFPSLEVEADLPLPRDKERLHYPDNAKEQGPSPEVVAVSLLANTVAITLDLYGAVAFADLDAVLKGKWENLQSEPTSQDGSWGTSFPDRAVVVRAGEREYLIISNASANGGFAVFDMQTRKMIQHLPAAAGADAPLDFPDLKKAATVISGKVKSRGQEGLNHDITPGQHLVLLDYSSLEPGQPIDLQLVDVELPTLRIARAGPHQVVIFGPEEAVLVDVATTEILDRKPLPGTVVRALGIAD